MSKHALRKSDIKDLNERINVYGISLDPKGDKVEIVDNKIVLVNDKPEFFFFEHDIYILPTLKTVLSKNVTMKKVVVDMGAVKFVAGGADIMRPGIKEFDEFQKNDFVVIVDEKNRKPLAIGQMQNSSEELKTITTGKVIKNIHFVGDKIWNFGTEK